MESQRPVRLPEAAESKWYVSEEEFPGEAFPTYCSGSAYVTTVASVRKLVSEAASEHDRYLFIDDVFVTGVLRERARVPLYDWSAHFLVKHEDDRARLLAREGGFFSPLLMVAFDLEPEDVRVLFEKAVGCMRQQGRTKTGLRHVCLGF